MAAGYRLYPVRYTSFRQSTWVLYLELNGALAGKDEGAGGEHRDSGGHVLFLTPDLEWVPLPWLLFEASAQLPIVQDLNGTQLGVAPTFGAGGRVGF